MQRSCPPRSLCAIATRDNLIASALCEPDAEGPSTQYLRFLAQNPGFFMVLGTRVLKCWVLGPSGSVYIIRVTVKISGKPEGHRSYTKGP